MKIVLSTFPDDQDVEEFSKKLLQLKLAACVNIIAGLKSIYLWESELCESQEKKLIIKTTEAKLQQLEQHFRSEHPYKVFEFSVLSPTDFNQEYALWVQESIGH